jgi:hypothetical protein
MSFKIMKLFKFSMFGLFMLGALLFGQITYAEQEISVSISANPPRIMKGESSTISWTSTGATDCELGAGKVVPAGSKISQTSIIKKFLNIFSTKRANAGASGSKIVNPTVTTSYTVTCSNKDPNLTKMASVTVTVTNALPDLVAVASNGELSGNTLTFSPTITNQGSITTGSVFSNILQFRTQTMYDDRINNSASSMSALAPGQSGTGSFSASIVDRDWTWYQARFCADQNVLEVGTISEFDETNNCSSWSCSMVYDEIQSTGSLRWGNCSGVGGGGEGELSGEITVTDCTIYLGEKSCLTEIGWNTINPEDGFISSVTTPLDTIVATANSGVTTYSINPGNTKFYLYHHSQKLDEAEANAACTVGTKWDKKDGCIVDGDSPVGVLSASNCIIEENSNSCNSNLAWDVINPIDGANTAVTTTPDNTEIGTGFPGTKTYSINYGSRTFYLYHNQGLLVSKTANATCANKTVWNGTICQSKPDLIASLPTPTSAIIDIPMTFFSTITNKGTTGTGAGFTNLFQVSTLPNGGGELTDYAVPGMSVIPADQAKNTSKSITFSASGVYYMRVCADKNSASGAGTIFESIENNNCSPWVVITVSPEGSTIGDLSGEDCEIKKGESDCKTKLTLDITNPVDGAETNITKSGNIEVAADIDPAVKNNIIVNYPGTTFYLNHNGATLDSEPVGASCEEGTGWKDGKCEEGGGEGGDEEDLCPNDPGIQLTRPCPGDEDLCPDDQGIQTTRPCPSDENLSIDFSASPTKIFRGKSSKLIWRAPLADSCRAVSETGYGEWSTGSTSPSGEVSVFPTKTTKYKISCSKGSVSATAETPITVNSINIIER